MLYGNLILIGFYSLLLAFLGVAKFFSSDYAQRKWNPDYKEK